MDPIVLLVIVGLGVAAFLAAYKFKGAIPLPERKPSIAFLPKYLIAIPIPAKILSARDPLAELARLMEPLGFAVAEQSARQIRFSRGSMLGEFSIKIAKLDVTFSLRIEENTQTQVVYGAFAALDTGDLWQFSTELRSKIAHVA